MSVNPREAFNNAVNDYRLLSNGGDCIKDVKEVENSHVTTVVSYAAEELKDVNCNAQFAVFCIFKHFDFESIHNLPFPIETDVCATAVYRVVKMLEVKRNQQFLQMSDNNTFEGLKEGVLANLNFEKELTNSRKKLEELRDDLKKKEDAHKKISYCTNKTGKYKECMDGMDTRKAVIEETKQKIRKYATCSTKGGAKSKRRVKKSRRSRKHRKQHK
jgi:hypothetical protein